MNDLLGHPLTDDEVALLSLYEDTKRLLARPDLAPAVRRNLGVALAALWNATNDLGLQFEQVYYLGV